MARSEKTPGHRERTIERRLMAFELRKAGLDYETIARSINDEAMDKWAVMCKEMERLGHPLPEKPKAVTARVVCSDVLFILNELHEKLTDSARDVRQLESARLDSLFFLAWKAAKGSAHPPLKPGEKPDPRRVQNEINAMQACVKIQERRSKLLGLDAKIEVNVSSEADTAKATLLGKFAALFEPGPAEEIPALPDGEGGSEPPV